MKQAKCLECGAVFSLKSLGEALPLHTHKEDSMGGACSASGTINHSGFSNFVANELFDINIARVMALMPNLGEVEVHWGDNNLLVNPN